MIWHRRVFHHRCLILILLLLVSGIIALCIYLYSSEKEEENIRLISCPPSIALLFAATRVFGHSFSDWLSLWARRSGCPNACIFADSHTRCKEGRNSSADALIFHSRDLSLEHRTLRRNSSSHQLFILATLEAPPNSGSQEVNMFPLDFFDATISYSTASDFHVTYDSFVPITNRTSSASVWTEEEVKSAIDRKNESAFTLISNCVTHSLRESLIPVLEEAGIQINHRGKCAAYGSCNEECERQLIDTHRFYIAFENSACQEYATEKAFKMKNLVVPIVLSRRLVGAVLPADSFIAIDDFNSPLKLAEHLKMLERNRTAYSSYFEWTRRYEKTSRMSDGLCRLCDQLAREKTMTRGHSTHPTPKTAIRTVFSEDQQCVQGIGEKLLGGAAAGSSASHRHRKLLFLLFASLCLLFFVLFFVRRLRDRHSRKLLS